MRSFPLASTLQTSLATWMDSLRPPAQECSSSSEPDDLSRDGAGPRISSRAARKSARADTLRRCNDPICRQWLGVSCNLFQNCEKQREPEPTASSISWTFTIARRSCQRSPHPANVMSLTVTSFGTRRFTARPSRHCAIPGSITCLLRRGIPTVSKRWGATC